jgi:hypothetical protein
LDSVIPGRPASSNLTTFDFLFKGRVPVVISVRPGDGNQQLIVQALRFSANVAFFRS